MSDAAVLDSSAVLALLQREPGQHHVAPLVGRAAWSAVNLCEVAGKLADRGMPEAQVREALDSLHLTVHRFDDDLGYAAAELRRRVPRAMSVGDRACVALALRLRLPAVTADREWRRLDIDELVVTVIR
jgi:PIN domain nuclease of toxin-antitoxin system